MQWHNSGEIKHMSTVKIIRDGARNLNYATSHSAGMDLVACLNEHIYTLHPGEHATFNTGIILNLEPDQVALVYGRSGLGINHGIVLRNGTGVIDADYKGEVLVCLVNTGTEPVTIHNEMRIAQMVITRFERFENVPVNDTVRGTGGFGSTGQ